MLLISILLISTLLLGYLWGKHDGRVEGYQRGTVDLPLLLREQSLEQGYCVLCNEQVQLNLNMETSGGDSTPTVAARGNDPHL